MVRFLVHELQLFVTKLFLFFKCITIEYYFVELFKILKFSKLRFFSDTKLDLVGLFEEGKGLK